MTRERQLFQQSLVPRIPVKFSWRKAVGWGSLVVDLTLCMVYSEWRPGYLVFPTWFLLSATRLKRSAERERLMSDESGLEHGQ